MAKNGNVLPTDAEQMEENTHKRYICSFPDCSAAYNRMWKLDAHVRTHIGVKPHVCGHEGCGKSFGSMYHLGRHELTHSGERPFRCSASGCPEAFTTNANLQRHVGRIHTQETHRYVCTFDGCGLRFKKNKLLKSHMCEQHAQLPPYACSHEGCHMRFTFPSRLKRHEKVHKGYPCKEESCTFTGNTWTEYLKHTREQHRPVLKCDLCSKVFRDAWSLQQHQHVHSDTRVIYKCPRDSCERSFTSTFNLQSHIRSFHEELRPFTCPHTGCGKTFAMRQSLQRHGVVHDPERKPLKRPRPKRSLASRLSGCSEKTYKKVEASLKVSGQKQLDPSGPVELVTLLQDTSLLGVDAQGLMANALTAPLSV